MQPFVSGNMGGMGVIAGATGKVLEGAGAATSGGRTD